MARKSGVLMHISSIPGPYGIGTFGDGARRFIDFLADMDFSVWQVLPFHPVNMSNSPYESESAFAGNPLFIDPEELVRDGLISREDERSCVYDGSPYTADYAFAARTRDRVLRKAYENAGADVLSKVKEFADSHEWVRSYALYKALKNAEGERPWYEWRQELTDYNSASEYADGNETGYIEFVQYEFFRQWERIKSYAASRNIKILGDMPIYVSFDSADVWSNKELFMLDPDTGRASEVAGVPPDYFSTDGQLWGNPLYNWEAMEADGFRWWKNRIREELNIYDSLRIDHFRGLASYWAVDADSETAKNGRWKTGPGMKFFNAVQDVIDGHEIIAEDLGVFGGDVVKLLDDTGFPGIRVIQFGFDPNSDSTHLPHNYPKKSVACIGTHDNNTLLGMLWEASPDERQFALDYCGFDGGNWGDGGFSSPSCRKIIETVWRSSSDTAIIAFQDMCGFGSDARMNTPGVAEGNWLFRTTDGTIGSVDKEYFKKINRIFRRG